MMPFCRGIFVVKTGLKYLVMLLKVAGGVLGDFIPFDVCHRGICGDPISAIVDIIVPSNLSPLLRNTTVAVSGSDQLSAVL